MAILRASTKAAIMSYSRQVFEQYASELVLRQRREPRVYDRRMLLHVILDPVLIFGFLFAFAALLAGIYWLVRPNASELRLIGAVISIGFGIFGISVPFIAAYNHDRALKYGVVARARVREIGTKGAAMGETVHGLVSGTWEVEGPSGSFTTSFRLDRPWAHQLQPGTSVVVLVHPKKPKVLLELG